MQIRVRERSVDRSSSDGREDYAERQPVALFLSHETRFYWISSFSSLLQTVSWDSASGWSHLTWTPSSAIGRGLVGVLFTLCHRRQKETRFMCPQQTRSNHAASPRSFQYWFTLEHGKVFWRKLKGNSVHNSASSRSVDYYQDLSDISMDSSSLPTDFFSSMKWDQSSCSTLLCRPSMRMLHLAPLKELILIDSASSMNEWLGWICERIVDSFYMTQSPHTTSGGHGWLHSLRSQIHQQMQEDEMRAPQVRAFDLNGHH